MEHPILVRPMKSSVKQGTRLLHLGNVLCDFILICARQLERAMAWTRHTIDTRGVPDALSSRVRDQIPRLPPRPFSRSAHDPPNILGLTMALARWRQVLFSKNRPSVLLVSFISWRRRLQFVARPEVSVSMFEEVQDSSMHTRVQFWPLRPVTSVVDFYSSCYACLFVLGKALILPFGFSSMAGPCCCVAVARFHGNFCSHRFRFLSS